MTTIAYVVNSLNLGGTENLVMQMSRAFSSEHSVFVICLDEPGLWAANLRSDGIAVYCVNRQPGLDLRIATRIAALTRKNNVDLIHAHQSSAWFYSALSRLFHYKPRLLFEEHGRFHPEVRNLKKIVVNKVFIQYLTHKVVAVSNDVGRRLEQFEGISEKKIETVYNGVKPPILLSTEERTNLRCELGIRDDEFLIGSVGRLDPIKNYPLLLYSFAEFQKEFLNAKLVFVGDGPDIVELQTIAADLGIAGKVVFTGYRQDATRVLQCFDLFVLCSFSEGTSMALLEAMGSCIPSIVTDVGGNPELILYGESGWVIPSDNISCLIAALREAKCECAMSQEYAKRSQQRFLEKFSFDNMITSYQKLYNSMLH